MSLPAPLWYCIQLKHILILADWYPKVSPRMCVPTRVVCPTVSTAGFLRANMTRVTKVTQGRTTLATVDTDNTGNCRHCQLSTLTTLSKVDTDNTVNCWHWTQCQLSILTTLSTVDTDKTVNCQQWTHRVCNSKTGHTPIHLSISCVALEFISVISTFVLI